MKRLINAAIQGIMGGVYLALYHFHSTGQLYVRNVLWATALSGCVAGLLMSLGVARLRAKRAASLTPSLLKPGGALPPPASRRQSKCSSCIHCPVCRSRVAGPSPPSVRF